MVRVKSSVTSRKRHKRVLKKAKGAWGQRSNIFRRANETVRRALCYAYRDRRVKKREFRQLWITRLSAACLPYDISYSRFINGLKKAEVLLNRKMLSEIAIHDAESFGKIVEIAKTSLQ